ncbi:MAG: carboxypeptidase-like regulatory domain-containing protein [Aestuariibaculum sp.]
MISKKYIILKTVLLLYTTNFFAQINIKGTILDKTNKIAISNVNIYVENTAIGTISNLEGEFSLHIPETLKKHTLVMSSIGYHSTKINIEDLKSNTIQYLAQKTTALDEVTLISKSKLTGQAIMQRALNNFSNNYLGTPYASKAFIRHTEHNKKEYKWLIEAAITYYDSGVNEKNPIKINIEETRKSLDLRAIDSVFLYQLYLTKKGGHRLKKAIKNTTMTDTASISEITNAIKWNDNNINGINNLFEGKLNIIRNATKPNALFGETIFKTHTFTLDTTLIEDNKIVYKIKITPNKETIDLKTKWYNGGLVPIGWAYIYKHNYAIKEIDYALIAASKNQKLRSELLFDTKINHKVKIKYIEHNNKMYLKYFLYETPKIVNFILKPDTDGKYSKNSKREREEQFYYTKQEILFTEIITNESDIKPYIDKANWNSDVFSPTPYNKAFWDNYNILLESAKEAKLINDLEKKVSLKQQFENN